MELNREQIIKALECCTEGRGYEDCKKCPIRDSCGTGTIEKLALSLIKELTEENERLKEYNKYYSELEQGCFVTGVKNVIADTVRKMHSMLCEDRVSNDPVVIAVNVVAKEMLEDNNND